MNGPPTQTHPKPLLTIAIPTYNRSRYLRELLQSLLEELRGESRVELIVSDNASPDETPQLIEELRTQGLELRLIRNETNIGSDANFLQCFEQAQGKYVWLMSDDDIILQGCIKQILIYLESDDYSLLFLAPYGFDNDPIAEFKGDRFGREATTINRADLFVKRVGTGFSLITCNIVNKQQILTTDHRPFANYIGTNLVQLSWTYTLLTAFSKGLFVHHRFLAIRNGTSGGYSVTGVFGENLKSITDELLADRPKLAKLTYCSALTGFLPYAILKIRQDLHGNFEKEDFHKKLRPVYGDDLQYWIYVFPVSRLPLALASVWFAMLCKLNTARLAGRLLLRLASGVMNPIGAQRAWK